jgi:hypothetical protein
MSEEDKDDHHFDARAIRECKFKELDTANESIEMRILGDNPTFLTRSATNKPRHPTYANYFYMQMALGVFRQWLAKIIYDGRTEPILTEVTNSTRISPKLDVHTWVTRRSATSHMYS